MRLSKFPLNTYKEVPAEAELASHKLMLRAGLIRRLASGLFTWMPIGLKVLRKVEHIVREEMDNAGAYELLMPAVQPAELWQETGRWDVYGPLLLTMKDRHDREFCFGPTHEEVITDVARRELRSYKQLPVTYYQIQTKFRDEIRPRFGLMRAREFLMKDGYSFHADQESLDETYRLMADAYLRIFDRLGLACKAVDADGGEIGGATSREFHVLANSGEDSLAYVDAEDFAMNVELAPVQAPTGERPAATQELTKVATPNAKTIDQVTEALGVAANKTVKMILVQGEQDENAPEKEAALVALLVRGDHDLNPVKAGLIDGVHSPMTLAEPAAIVKTMNSKPGFVGPVGCKLRVIADHAAVHLTDFVCGANENGFHLQGVNWGRDLPEPEAVDLRNIAAGDLSPNGNPIAIARGIEVGHIFQLGDKYSTSMNAVVLDSNGREQPMLMGCYGIGVSRIVAAAIEQNHDDKGIVWPGPLAPFPIVLLALNAKKSAEVRSAADELYATLCEAGFEVLYDDRDVRAGIMFADADLLGVPHQIVIGDRGLKQGVVEYRDRKSGDSQEIGVGDIATFVGKHLSVA